jgi:hypothetical protein
MKIELICGASFFAMAVGFKIYYNCKMLQIPSGYRQYLFSQYINFYNLGWFAAGISTAFFMLCLIELFDCKEENENEIQNWR